MIIVGIVSLRLDLCFVPCLAEVTLLLHVDSIRLYWMQPIYQIHFLFLVQK